MSDSISAAALGCRLSLSRFESKGLSPGNRQLDDCFGFAGGFEKGEHAS